MCRCVFLFFKQKPAYEMRISDWSQTCALPICETIFHQRGSTESLGGVLQVMLARLRSGHSVGVFPEGRTGHGDEVGPFHARIFLAAVEAGAPVQPVALRYGADASAQTIVAFRQKARFLAKIGRETCRERVCHNALHMLCAVASHKKSNVSNHKT